MKKFLFSVISIFAIISFILSFSGTALAAEENSDYVGTEENESTFSEIYSLVLENVDKIFSALAFVSSLLLVFAYKKGLIPIINTGLSAIKKSADKFEGSSLESILKTEESLGFLTDKFASCINTVEGISKSVEELGERLKLMEGEKNNGETVKTVMLSQIDMLYEIFMNSALPQYSKDALGEKVAEMKKSIRAGE